MVVPAFLTEDLFFFVNIRIEYRIQIYMHQILEIPVITACYRVAGLIRIGHGIKEGWNYHLEKKEGPLKYNGVVYNEMKGAFSSPDDVLEREIMNSLFPDDSTVCGNPEIPHS